jgi:hypothetical protein
VPDEILQEALITITLTKKVCSWKELQELLLKIRGELVSTQLHDFKWKTRVETGKVEKDG